MATTEVERLVVRLMGDNFAYLAMLKAGSAATTKFAATAIAQFKAVGTAAIAMGTKIKAVGSRLSMYLTAPLLLIAATSTYAFANFDKAMVESTSIMKVTTAQADEMRRVALKLSTDGRVPQGPKDLAKSYFYLASAGLDAEQSMAALPQVAMFATAGAFDMATATSLAADAQSALGLKAADAAMNLKGLTRVTDVLVRANTLANANVEQFSTALTNKAGASLKSYNKSIEEGVAVLAAFADQGIKAQLAGNNLSRVMLLLSKAAIQNQSALKKYNMQVFDARGNMRNLADIVENMETSFATLTDKQRAAALMQMGFSARVQGAILPLIGTSEKIRFFQKELEKATGYTKDVAEKQMKSFSNQMAVVKNRVVEMGISIGETLAPILKKVGSWISVVTERWKKLSPEVKKAIVQAALWAAAAGPILIIVGILVKLLGGFIIALASAASAVMFLITPLGLLLTTLTAIGAVLLARVDFRGIFTKAKEYVTGFVANFKENMGILGDWLKKKWGVISGILTGVWEKIGPPINEALDAVGRFVLGTIGFLTNLKTNLNRLWEWIKASWLIVLKELGKAWWQMQKNMLSNYVVVIQAIGKVAIAGAKFQYRVWTTAFKSIGSALTSVVRETFEWFITSSVSAVKGLLDTWRNWPRYMANIFTEVGKGWWNLHKKMLDSTIATTKAGLSATAEMHKTVGSKVWDAVYKGDFLAAVTDGLKDAGSLIGKFVDWVYKRIKSGLTGQPIVDEKTLAEDLGKLPDKILEGLDTESFIAELQKIGEDAVAGLKSPLEDVDIDIPPLPDLEFELPDLSGMGLDLPEFNLDPEAKEAAKKGGEKIGETMGEGAAKGVGKGIISGVQEAADQASPIAIKVKPELVRAIEWGSPEMMQDLANYLAGAPKLAQEAAAKAPKKIKDFLAEGPDFKPEGGLDASRLDFAEAWARKFDTRTDRDYEAMGMSQVMPISPLNPNPGPAARKKEEEHLAAIRKGIERMIKQKKEQRPGWDVEPVGFTR